MAELKRCPFCGSDAELSHSIFYVKNTSYVLCKQCGASGAVFYTSSKYSSDEKAIEAWNRRAEDG